VYLLIWQFRIVAEDFLFKLLNASPAWWGLTSSADKQRLLSNCTTCYPARPVYSWRSQLAAGR